MCRCMLISLLLAFFANAIIFTDCAFVSSSSNFRHKALTAFEPVMNCVIYFSLFSQLLLIKFVFQLFLNLFFCLFFEFLKLISHLFFQFTNLIVNLFVAFLQSAEIRGISLKVKLGIFCFLQLEFVVSLNRLLAKLIELFLISDEKSLVLIIDEGELVILIALQLKALFYLLTESRICLAFELNHMIAIFEVQLDFDIHILINECNTYFIM